VVVRLEGCHLSWTPDSQMALRLSALHAGHNLLTKRIPDTNFCLRLTRPQGRSALRSISQLKNPVTSWIMERTTIHLLSYCPPPPHLNHLQFCMIITNARTCTKLQLFVSHHLKQGVSKGGLQVWKLMWIYSEDMFSVLNCHNVEKHRVLSEIVTVQCNFHW
jgi:hypothetical protein